MFKEEGYYMPVISNKTKENICTVIGLGFDELTNMDFEQEIEFVTKKNHSKPVFPNKPDIRKRGRGNPLISRRRVNNIENVNARLAKIK